MDSKSGHRFENSEGNNKVRGKNNVVFKVNTEAVGCELLAENVELFFKLALLMRLSFRNETYGSFNILGPLMDNVTTGIGLD